jgi:maltose-binding protein MalE
MLEGIRQSFRQFRLFWILGSIIILLIISVVVVISLNRQPTRTTVVTNTPVELTWWKTDGDIQVYQEAITAFRAIPGNQNVNIKIIEKNDLKSFYSDLIIDLARGVGPDIFTLRNDDLPAYKEFVAPIEIFSGKDLTDYKQNFVNLAVRDTMDKDKVYGITNYVDNLQLYYNPNILSQKRIAKPASDWAELSNQVRNISRFTIGQNQNLDVYTIALGTGGINNGEPNIENHQQIIPMLIFQQGGSIYDYQTQKVDLNSNNNIFDNPNQQVETNEVNEEGSAYKALRFYYDFADINTNRYSWNTNSPKAIDAFVEGKLAYIIGNKTLANQISERNNRLNFQVTSLPQFNQDNKKTFGEFYMQSLNRNLATQAQANPKDLVSTTKYQKAQEFMYYLSNKETQSYTASKTGKPSAHRDVITEQLNSDQITRTFAEGALYAENYYKADVERTEQIWSDLFERVTFEGMPLSESFAKAISEYQLLAINKPKLRS